MNNGQSKNQQWQAAASHPSSHAEIISRSGNKLVVKVHGRASHCLDDINKYEVAVCFDWKFSQLREAVKVVNESWVTLPPPHWISDVYPLTVRQFGFEFRVAVFIKFLLNRRKHLLSPC